MSRIPEAFKIAEDFLQQVPQRMKEAVCRVDNDIGRETNYE